MSAQSFREYPDPVVAACLDSVRALADDQFRILNGPPQARLIRLNDPLTWVFAPIAAWIELKKRLILWTMRRIGMGGCNDPEALREYRIFWARLDRRGASRSAEMHVAMGLLALRSRDLGPDWPQTYAKHMGSFVPATSLGWTVGEASALRALQLTGAPSIAVDRLLRSSHHPLQRAYCGDRPQLNSGVRQLAS